MCCSVSDLIWKNNNFNPLNLASSAGTLQQTVFDFLSLSNVLMHFIIFSFLLSLHPVVSSTGTELISGQQLNLTCGLEQPLPSDLHLKWLPPKQSTLSDPWPSSPLIIPLVSTADAGTWRCELWRNNTQLTWAEITLEIGECRKWEQKTGSKTRAWPCGHSPTLTWFYRMCSVSVAS